MPSRRSLPLLAATLALFLPAVSRAADTPPPAPAAEETYHLPELRVEEKPFQEFQFPTKEELQRPDFAPGTPPLDFVYPGRAYYDGVFKGQATVGLMLDSQGKVVDSLIVGYTRVYFGEILLKAAREMKFSPRRLRGTALPSSFVFTHEFRPPTKANALSSFDAVDHRTETIKGGPKYSYEPYRENEIDGGALEPLRMVIPPIPSDYPASAKPPKVLVTFYVDEQGRVRLPNVESSTTPALALRALEAVQYWAFKPPTRKGESVLVYAYRALTFRPETK